MAAGSFVCSHSIFDLISKLAELQLQDEWAQKHKPAANAAPVSIKVVAHRRSQIYETLLRVNENRLWPELDTYPQCKKLLNEQRANFDAQLLTDVANCLLQLSCDANGDKQKAELLLLRLQTAARNTFEYKMKQPEALRLKRVFRGQRQLQQSPLFHPKAFQFITHRNDDECIDGLQFDNSANSHFALRAVENSNWNNPPYNPYTTTWRISFQRLNEAKKNTLPLTFKLPLPPKQKQAPPKKESKPISRCHVKHFVSDVSLNNEIKWHHDRSIELQFIELPKLIDHLKKVSVGLQSETFSLTPNGHFLLRPNKTVRTLLPEVLAEFAQPFLDSGRAYMRLCFRTQRDQYLSQTERPMNRTMRNATLAIMANSRAFLLSQPAKNLPDLLRSATPAMQLLQQIDQMFQNDPCANIANGASGASLLSVVWSEIDTCVNTQYLQILMYLLRLICETYYRQLERWLYEGELDEPFNELFVSSTRCTDERSKEFFDKGYQVRSHMVPGFLAGIELAVVECGKYSRLLKRYNAQHALFKSKPPNLAVCLTEEQVTNMQNRLKIHYKSLQQSITPFSMQSMLDERSVHSHRFGNRMWSCTQERIADWEENQRELLDKANEDKQRRYAELNAERMEEEELRLEQRREEIATELIFREQCEQQNEERLQREKLVLEQQIGDLKKFLQPAPNTAVEVSPDESSSSGRSFVSCCEEFSTEAKSVDEASEEPATEETSQRVLEAKESPQDVAELPINIKRADVQNSNVTEIDRNRQRNISSGQFLECHTQVELRQTTASDVLTDMETNRLRVLNCTNVTTQLPAEETTKQPVLTDAESNRLKVLNCTEMTAQLPADVNMNVEDLSDLQRNRQRMLHDQNFGAFRNVTIRKKKTEMSEVGNDTESNLKLHLPLEPHKLFVEPTLDTATPMSTTSDVEVELYIPKETIDAANNNVSATLDCEVVEENQEEDASNISKVTSKKLPESPGLERKAFNWSKPIFRLHNNELAALSSQIQLPKEHNPFLIKRYVQQSILLPLEAHLSLLRNEVLRIFDDLNVFEHFCQLRNYYFLLDGEFGTSLVGGILERIEAGMDPRSLCQKGTLDIILKNALGRRATDAVGAAAVFTENLTLICSNIPESFDLMNIDVLSIFALDCKVNWPLNLVISAEIRQKYTYIFSYLLKLRHVSFMLERAYQHLQQLAKLLGKAIHMAPQYRHLQLVRRKLAHFVLTLQNHLETNALQGTWRIFNDKLRNVETVEELYQRHVEYIKQIAFISLLNRQSAKFRNTIDSILVIVLRFCKILHSKPFVLDQNQEFIHPRYKRLVFEEAEFEKFMLYVIYLGNKIDASGYQEKIVELISIINFNNYYNVTNGPNQTK